MKYEIIERSDPLQGVSLTVRVDEADLDQKAFYTIQRNAPDFLVPFSHQSVNGQLELDFHIGQRSKMLYFCGVKSKSEYISFWDHLLNPLMECSDWFLSPYSFVLDTKNIYQDKDGTISYLYIPTKTPISDQGNLTNLVGQMAKSNSVKDMTLENAVLRMLVQDFQPKTFLAELHSISSVSPSVGSPAVQTSAPRQNIAPVQQIPPPAYQPQQQFRQPQPVRQPQQVAQPQQAMAVPMQNKSPTPPGDGLFINLNGNAPQPKEKKKRMFGGGKDKKAKGKSKNASVSPNQFQPTAAPQPPVMDPQWQVPQRPSTGNEQFIEEATQLEERKTGLRLIGAAGLPPFIRVNISVGEIFSIGRFDVKLGQKQSSFEFAPNTKAVSRHHAVIERDPNGFVITDILSKAGTFVDGVAIRPNMAFRLRSGMRISFGSGGADYIWEE